MPATAIVFIQKVLHITLARPLRSWLKIRSHISPQLTSLADGRYIIVVNHCKRLDPYVITAALPYKVFVKLLPLRFFVANTYLRCWWQRLLLYPQGCFPAEAIPGRLSGVLGGMELLDSGQNLVIFPQGKRTSDFSASKLQHGIGLLARHNNVTILPVGLEYRSDSHKTTNVSWGAPFDARKDRATFPALLTQEIFRRIIALTSRKD